MLEIKIGEKMIKVSVERYGFDCNMGIIIYNDKNTWM